MNKPPLIAGLMFAVIAVLLGAYLLVDSGRYGADRGEDDDDDAPSRVEDYQGLRAIRIPVELQQQSGVQISRPKSVQWGAEFSSYGQVIDITPLLQLRASYQKFVAERDIVSASLQNMRHSLDRLQDLHREQANISTRQLQQAQAELNADQARLRAVEVELSNLRAASLQSWGEVLTGWAFDDERGHFKKLIQREELLLLIGLGNEQALPEGTQTIHINQVKDRTHARAAHLISAAPRTLSNMQGETYYFRTNAGRLRTGMHIHAWIARSSEAAVPGVILPAAAIIWHAGKPWVYVKQAEELFVRHPVDEYQELEDGWFVQDGTFAGKWIVNSGAPMLLSEEFRWQIPDEDDEP